MKTTRNVKKKSLVPGRPEVLVAREAGKRLAALFGSQPKLRQIPRRRSRAKNAGGQDRQRH
jgi:hypothetical protein